VEVQAAELPAELVLGFDAFEESEVVFDDAEEESEADFDDDSDDVFEEDDAGLLLEEEPRLSFR
jgi:hypothetical protein